jgi:hypothetical protein
MSEMLSSTLKCFDLQTESRPGSKLLLNFLKTLTQMFWPGRYVKHIRHPLTEMPALARTCMQDRWWLHPKGHPQCELATGTRPIGCIPCATRMPARGMKEMKSRGQQRIQPITAATIVPTTDHTCSKCGRRCSSCICLFRHNGSAAPQISNTLVQTPWSLETEGCQQSLCQNQIDNCRKSKVNYRI